VDRGGLCAGPREKWRWQGPQPPFEVKPGMRRGNSGCEPRRRPSFFFCFFFFLTSPDRPRPGKLGRVATGAYTVRRTLPTSVPSRRGRNSTSPVTSSATLTSPKWTARCRATRWPAIPHDGRVSARSKETPGGIRDSLARKQRVNAVRSYPGLRLRRARAACKINLDGNPCMGETARPGSRLVFVPRRLTRHSRSFFFFFF